MKTILRAAALVLSVPMAAAAHPVPAAATMNVNNVNDPVNKPYQASANDGCGYQTCSVSFSAVTAPETLVQHVSCYIIVSAPPSYIDVTLGIQNSQDGNYLQPSPEGDGTVLLINASTQLFFSSNTTPVITVNSSTSVSNANCTISGYHN